MTSSLPLHASPLLSAAATSAISFTNGQVSHASAKDGFMAANWTSSKCQSTRLGFGAWVPADHHGVAGGKSLAWNASDWVEGAVGCFRESAVAWKGVDLSDWREAAIGCSVEASREPHPKAELDSGSGAKLANNVAPAVAVLSHPSRKQRPSKERLNLGRVGSKEAQDLKKGLKKDLKHDPTHDQEELVVNSNSKSKVVENGMQLLPGVGKAAGVKASQGGGSEQESGCIGSKAVGKETTLEFDFLVIGSGIAGLRYALDVAKYGSVAVVTKAEPQEGSTHYAQGGVSAVLDPNDSVENHIRDTIVAGAYLNDEEVVEVVCREGPDRVRELMAMGASFTKAEDGQLRLAREGGHSHNRIVHAADVTGREIERALLVAVQRDENIVMFQHHFVVDLLTSVEETEMGIGSSVRCHGADVLDLITGSVVRFLAHATLLASGGAGHVYPNTTNPTVATGDGVALAQRAGAVISNMEFIQFHPTALADAGLPLPPSPPRPNAFLITEAVRGAGGVLLNQSGERFMQSYDPRGELAPRDVVARSIDDQLKRRGEQFVWLDISHKPKEEILSHFPNIAAECLRCGIDITKQPIPVVPAAHYMCGGVLTGLRGETSVQGLWAAGEVACTGLHGANRLASNSLLEALVFAQRAVEPAVEHVERRRAMVGGELGGEEEKRLGFWERRFGVADSDPLAKGLSEMTSKYRKELQDLMWKYVGIVRSTQRLQIACQEVEAINDAWEQQVQEMLHRCCKDGPQGEHLTTVAVCEMRNLVAVARLVVHSALRRQESRGLHFTTDFPQLVESERLPTILSPLGLKF